MPNFHGTQVEATVWLWLRDLLKHPEKITEGLAAEREESARKYGPLRDRLALIENRLAETQAEQAELLALYLSRKFKPEVLDARKAQLDKAEADLSRERAELADYLKAEMLTDEQARTLELELADIREGYSGPINSDRNWVKIR